MKFIHTADLHLDAPFCGISSINDNVGTLLKESTFKAFRKVIQHCLEQKVDFLLISGDIYNAEQHSLKAQLLFYEGLKKLDEHNINVYIIHGNHDPLDSWSSFINLPPNTKVFASDKVTEVIHMKNGVPLAKIYGISYSQRHITDNLSQYFPVEETYASIFTIGMLHCELNNFSESNKYSPCSIEDLKSHNINYWALGHQHQNATLSTHPHIVYPGNIQGLQPNEPGNKSCTLVSVNEQNIIITQELSSHELKWDYIAINISGCENTQDLIQKIQNSLKDSDSQSFRMIRIELTGSGTLKRVLSNDGILDDIRNYINDSQGDDYSSYWIDKIIDNSLHILNMDKLKKRDDFIGTLLSQFELANEDINSVSNINDVIAPLLKSTFGRKYLTHINNNKIKEILRRSQNLCLDYLVNGEDDVH